MTRALFLDILKNNLIGPLILIIVVYLFYWCLMLTLGCRILNVKVNKIIFTFAVFIMLCNCIFTRWYIPPMVYGIEMAVLAALFLKINGGSACSISRALWSSISIILISALGDIFIFLPACLNKNVADFINVSPIGIAIGGLLETLFPALALIVLPRLRKLFLVPTFKKSDRYEIYVVGLYTLMYIALYLEMIIIYIGIANEAKYLFMYLILLWITTIGIILGHYMVIKSLNKRNEIQQKHHEEKLAAERQQFEIEQRQNQEKIDILTKMYERLKFMKVDQEIVDEVFNSAKKLEEYGRVLDAKKEFNFLFEKVLDGIEFTETEIKIMKLIVEGKSNREIGEILCFSESRIGNMISKIYAKAGINDRATLAAYYVIRSIFMNI
ncbi:MAG: LuxR C-terminal-related transcriptional regulator [Firmicutes bacterium]|nr:LuxR C-terminal-related transcriptional regulator [Bacillota bacterium]